MKILVIDDNYPSPDNLYGDVFAHVRVKEYRKLYPDIVVASAFTGGGDEDYVYEGVTVRRVESVEGLVRLIDSLCPDLLLVHFATHHIIGPVLLARRLPSIVWVHGFEALGWYRRLFNFSDPIHFARYIKGNVVQLLAFRRLIEHSNRSGHIHFVFVSDWMRRMTEIDCFRPVKRYSIIPNPINNRLFSPSPKSPGQRLKILMIRPFGSRKYATDIVTEAMALLQERSYFADLDFTIYGEGSTRSPLSKRFGGLPNISIKEGFLSQRAIKRLHDRHGVFLAITRQDAQGVSMCEAMSSGLVVISSKNTAIPEFVGDGTSGLLVGNRPEDLADAIERLYLDPDLFLRLSSAASPHIIAKAGMEMVIAEELKLIERQAYIR